MAQGVDRFARGHGHDPQGDDSRSDALATDEVRMSRSMDSGAVKLSVLLGLITGLLGLGL
jgi:hypothetical protein